MQVGQARTCHCNWKFYRAVNSQHRSSNGM